MIVWGGSSISAGGIVYGDGHIYDPARLDPATGQWATLPTSSAPSARRDHTGVWTGSQVLVWGGSSILDGGTVYDTGGRYRV